MTKRAQRYKGGPPAGCVTLEEARELLDYEPPSVNDEYELVLAQVELYDPPPLVQDQVALARIDADAPAVPYPLLNEDRQAAPLRRLAWYVVRLVWWRWRNRE